MIKHLIALMLITSTCWACDYCIENPGEKEIWDTGIGANNGMEQTQRCFIVLLKRINKLEKDIDTLHSLIADLHMKEMGVKRYEQIAPKDGRSL